MSLSPHTVQRLVELVEAGAQYQGALVETVSMAHETPLAFYQEVLQKYEPHNRLLVTRHAQICVLPFSIKTLDGKCVGELTVMMFVKDHKQESFYKEICETLVKWEKGNNKSSQSPF